MTDCPKRSRGISVYRRKQGLYFRAGWHGACIEKDRMRLRIVLGIIYLALLKASHAHHRASEAGADHASVVWGSAVPSTGKPA
jgi:hypothetical protein